MRLIKIILFVILMVAIVRITDNSVPDKEVIATANRGDTIWSMVGNRITDADNIQDYVRKTIKANPGINVGDIIPGTKITLVLPDRK